MNAIGYARRSEKLINEGQYSKGLKEFRNYMKIKDEDYTFSFIRGKNFNEKKFTKAFNIIIDKTGGVKLKAHQAIIIYNIPTNDIEFNRAFGETK